MYAFQSISVSVVSCLSVWALGFGFVLRRSDETWDLLDDGKVEDELEQDAEQHHGRVAMRAVKEGRHPRADRRHPSCLSCLVLSACHKEEEKRKKV